MSDGAYYYRRYLDGDTAAFDEILHLYLDSLTLFLRQYVHNVQDAEDLAIDTLLVLLTDPKRFHPDRPLKPYLFAVARNKAINFLRRRGQCTTLSAEEMAEELADSRSLEDAVLVSEQNKALYRALDTLPEEMRLAVYMVYFEQLSYGQTAKILHKSPKQIDNLLYRAKNELRELLKGEYPS